MSCMHNVIHRLPSGNYDWASRVSSRDASTSKKNKLTFRTLNTFLRTCHLDQIRVSYHISTFSQRLWLVKSNKPEWVWEGLRSRYFGAGWQRYLSFTRITNLVDNLNGGNFLLVIFCPYHFAGAHETTCCCIDRWMKGLMLRTRTVVATRRKIPTKCRQFIFSLWS